MAITYLNPKGVTNETKVGTGVHTTASAVDTITIAGMTTILSAVATYKTDPADANILVSCTWTGNVLTIKTWKTDGSDPTPVAATSFSKDVSYVVIGY